VIIRGVLLIAASLVLGLLVDLTVVKLFDHAVLGGLALRTGPGSDTLITVAQALSWFGDTARRVPMVLGLVAWLIWKRRRVAGLTVLAVPLITAIASSLMKDAYGRARPDLVPHLDLVNNLSYPSGHASNAAAFFVLAAMVVPGGNRTVWVALALIGAVSIGLSRPMLGVHWPTDVIGGWMLGLGFALIGAALVERFEGKAKWQADQPALS
jgi:undecaprenyl-diphosphatase